MIEVCKICRIAQPRRLTEIILYGQPVYQDLKGKVWHGMLCPDCSYEKHTRRKNDQKELLGPPMKSDPLTKRKCRKCELPLPKSRYFRHITCDPAYKSEFEAWGADEWGYSCVLDSPKESAK